MDRKPWCLGGSFVLLGIVLTLTAGGSLAARLADPPTPQEADGADPLFTQPYVDADEWRDMPVRHRLVHGGFKGTDTRFTVYFPPKERYQGRFFQPLPAAAGQDNASQQATGAGSPIAFAAAYGAYLVDSNQGQTFVQTTFGEKVVPWRASAAVAKYSRVLAAQMYGPGRIYGYVYGGSGGSYKTFGCIENTVGVWDGAVPYIADGPQSLPNNYTVKGLALRVLKNKFPGIIDAVEPGGSGDMYAGLNAEERDVLTEVTRMGFPPRAWWVHDRLGMGPIAGSIFDTMQRWDPTYFENDFWKVSGYAGVDPPESFKRDRIVQYKTSVRTDLLRGTLGLSSLPGKGDLVGASVIIKSGGAAGRVLYVDRVVDAANGVVKVGSGPEAQQVSAEIKPGVEVVIDNSAYLAAQYYHRHQVPPDDPRWDLFRRADRKPVYPQRPELLGPKYFATNSGAAHTGRFSGKVIVLNMLTDEHANPIAADWYRSKVKAVLGSKTDEYYRLWFADNAFHGQPVDKTDNVRVINYQGMLQQAILDMTAWVEKGVSPAPTTNYKAIDGQIQVPPTAAERKGIQPVVTVTANGRARAEVAVGERVRFSGVIDVPPNTGVVVAAEWDFEGIGDYPIVETLNAGFSGWRGPENQESPLTVETTYAFSKPGTYFPALRTASQRHGDANTPFTRVFNLGRVRVVVE